MSAEVDIVVIGAGPAGMMAAASAACAGASVVVLDEQTEPGGQIYRAIDSVRRTRPADLSFLGPAYAHGGTVTDRFHGVGLDWRAQSTVWHIGAPAARRRREVLYSQGGASHRLRARYVVIAEGALERPVPIPGWTLPGVMTAGGVQALLKSSGIYPAGRLVLAGSGSLILQLAAQLIAAHVPIAAFVDTTPPGGMARALRHLPRALLAAPHLVRGVAWMRALKKSGVPIWRAAGALAVEGDGSGDDKAARLCFSANGTRHRLGADVIALHEGVIPNTQLSRLVGADHRWHPDQQCFEPVTDQWGETSAPGVYSVGDGAGIAGALAAERGGEIAGLALAERLGLMSEAARDLRGETLRLQRFIDRGPRPFLDSYFPPPAWIGAVGDETMICRCEGVTAGRLRLAVNAGCLDPDQAKSFLGCGMGPCRGRMCDSIVTQVIAEARGVSADRVGSYRVRSPIKPVPLNEMAALERGDDGP